MGENLRIHFEPLFITEKFWKIIENYEGQIKEIKFELITPNMSNISSILVDELQEFVKETNTSKTNIEFASDPDAALSIKRDNNHIVALVKYASDGGGNISVKVSGFKKRKRTNESIRSIEIDEFQFEANSIEEIIELLKGMMTF